MTILSVNLKLRQSERMTDFADGGGRMSAVEIVDGMVNNVFADRSDLDAIVGRVSLRKIFTQVATANTDTFLGAFVFLTDPPADPLVHVIAFDTANPTDERVAAQRYIENYRLPGTKTQLTLYGRHLAGQQTLQVFCRENIASPDIGDVLLLSIEQSGYPANQQAVKVQEVTSRITVTFEDESGEFKRDVLVIRISAPLQYEFPGVEDPRRYTILNASPTVVRATQVADSARYYSVKPCTVAPQVGDLVVQVADPYLPIVPSTQAETPLTDVLAGLGTFAMVQSGVAASLTYSESITAASGVTVTRYFGTPYTRRSLNLTVGGVALRDNGNGDIVPVDPASAGWGGVADYSTGAFSVSRDIGFAGSVVATATPAGGVLQQGFSQALSITGANRQQSYVIQLPSKPAPGTAVLDYRALGKWIRLADNGAGQLAGNAGEGSATINYATGTVAATLGALPDVDTALIASWGVDVRARNSSGEITIPTPKYRQQLNHAGIIPGTLTMSWLSGGVAKSATAAASGAISGDATGTIDHAAGIIEFATSALPDANISYSHSHVPTDKMHMETFTPAPAGGAVSFTLAHPAAEHTVWAEWNVTYTADAALSGVQGSVSFGAVDDGVGGWLTGFPGTNTINYGTGAIVLTVESDIPAWIPQYATRQNETTGGTCMYVSGYTLGDKGAKFESGTPLVVRYIEQGASVTATSEGHPLPAIRIYLGDGAAGPTVPGSLRFSFRGRTYVDRGGSLVYGVAASTNAGTLGGTFDYTTNTATVSEIGAGTSNAVSIGSMLTRYIEPSVNGVVFRTPGAPLKAGSFTVRATTMSGTTLTGTADINGNITGSLVKGKVDWQSGLTEMVFGVLVTAAGNEGAPWYRPEYVVGGQIWKPEPIDPASIFFGTVVFRAIPLNPAILGLDPVRLPDDGRVLVYRPGDLVVVHHTAVTSVASPVAGSTTNLGRARLAFAEVYDSVGAPVLDTWYTVDLAAGVLTWANPLNLSAYTLPIRIRHRIEDAVLCADVQITGELSIQRAISHAFPAGTLVSSAIQVGDLKARAHNLFDQQTYQPGVWSDDLVGAPAGATYNDVNYPVAVENDSAIDERWAVVFSAPTVVAVIGETVGQIFSGSITSDIAPTNPVSGKPYFTIDADGWGSGWPAQSVFRFNTVSATEPTWLARVTPPGEITVEDDQVRFQIYGNAH